MVKIRSVILLALLFVLLCHGKSYSMADLSFVVIDLKYNQLQGVKICEMQPGSFSRFSGIDFLQEPNAIPKRYCSVLASYNLKGYFTHPLYQKMKQTFIESGWTSVHSVEELAQKFDPKIPNDPENLFDYTTCLFSLNPAYVLKKEQKRFPHILFLDRAILPYCQSKYETNLLFDQIQEAKDLRPIWRVYKKGTSQSLIDQIFFDIPGDRLVIKPLQSTMGRGVIILEKKDLEKTLHYIFRSSKETLLKDLERSYSQYAIDRSDYFMVEEFVPSDPLFLGEDLLPYDCTMRIMALLSYHQKVANITFLGSYWYSPKKPIDSVYTLIESHKAKGTYFANVDPQTFQEVQKQLTPALLKLYQFMISKEE